MSNDISFVLLIIILMHSLLPKAAGWELMRELSGNNWGMNIVVNIRGKAAGAPGFRENELGGGLFGNGITATTAKISTASLDDGVLDDEVARRKIVASALSCRAALTCCYKRLPDKIAASKMGNPIIDTSLGPAFCTTSWHFPLWEIDFFDELAVVEGWVDCKGNKIMEPVEDDEEHGRPFAFHGQPVHPLPPGEIFSAVIVPTACRGLDFQFFLPLHHSEKAKNYIKKLESLFFTE